MPIQSPRMFALRVSHSRLQKDIPYRVWEDNNDSGTTTTKDAVNGSSEMNHFVYVGG